VKKEVEAGTDSARTLILKVTEEKKDKEIKYIRTEEREKKLQEWKTI
jgi:hypothetical protein